VAHSTQFPSILFRCRHSSRIFAFAILRMNPNHELARENLAEVNRTLNKPHP